MSDPKRAVERHVRAFSAKNAEAEPVSPDAEFVTPVGEFRGREQVLGFLRGYWEAFPDARLEIIRSIEDGSLVAAEGLMMGTHTGGLRTPNGEVALGRAVKIRWMGAFLVASSV